MTTTELLVGHWLEKLERVSMFSDMFQFQEVDDICGRQERRVQVVFVKSTLQETTSVSETSD